MIIYYCLHRGHECFEDYIDSLGIIDCKIYYTKPSELNRDLFEDPKNIHIFRYEYPQFVHGNPRVYVLNTEQMTEAIRFNHIKRIIECGAPIIDYSLANVKILRSKFPKAKFFYLPYQYNDAEVKRLEEFSKAPTIDVGIVHCATSYRKQALNKLTAAGIKAVDVRGWKDQRDAKIGRCRILVNVHHKPQFKIFEHIRCDRWIFAGKTVISEPVVNEQLLDIHSGVIFTKDLVSCVRKALASPPDLTVDSTLVEKRRELLREFCRHINVEVGV